MFGEVKVLVADADAIRKFSAWKGTSGHKCCLECQNVVDFRSPYSHDPTGRNVPDTELDAAKFIPHNDDLAQVILQRVHDAKAVLSAVNFEEYKTRMGWSYVQRSAMQCPTCDFRLIACVMWDWAHIFFTEGCFTKEVEEFMGRLGRTRSGFGWGDLKAYLDLWTWPKGYATGKAIAMTGKKLANVASEQLSLAPVLARYVETHVLRAGLLPQEASSMLALCDVVDLLVLTQHGLATAALLDATVLRWQTLHQEAYGHTLWIKKLHLARHLSSGLLKHGFLVPLFTAERKHKGVKRAVKDRFNLTRFDAGMLEKLTVQHLHDIRTSLVTSAYGDAVNTSDAMRMVISDVMGLDADEAVTTINPLRVHCRSITNGDVALVRMSARAPLAVCMVWFHVGVRGRFYSVVAMHERLASTSHMLTSRCGEKPMLIDSAKLIESIIFLYTMVYTFAWYRLAVAALYKNDVGLCMGVD